MEFNTTVMIFTNIFNTNHYIINKINFFVIHNNPELKKDFIF